MLARREGTALTFDNRPSRVAINSAYEMGRTFAMTDPRLVPAMDNAHQYTSYLHFMTAHRHRLQRSVIFQEWDTPLQRLIEKEASRLGLKLEDSRQWEIVETSLSIPLHCAFWFGWETVHNLKTKFDKAIELHNCKQAAVENAVALSPLLSRMNRLDQPGHIDDSLESDVEQSMAPQPAIHQSTSDGG